MRKTVAAVTGVFVFTAWAVLAQERTPTTPERPHVPSGHAVMAQSGGDPSDAATIAKAVSAAPPEIGNHATVMGTGPDGKMKQLRAGTNGWMCMLDPVGNPMCLDKEWQ